MKILVADDPSTMRKILINCLRKAGYDQFVEATDGKEALAQLAAESVDLVITDWNMPNMSGLEFLQAIRSSGAFAKLPVIMVTTQSVSGDIQQAAQAGVNGYVLKPFTAETLQAKVEAVLSATGRTGPRRHFNTGCDCVEGRGPRVTRCRASQPCRGPRRRVRGARRAGHGRRGRVRGQGRCARDRGSHDVYAALRDGWGDR